MKRKMLIIIFLIFSLVSCKIVNPSKTGTMSDVVNSSAVISTTPSSVTTPVKPTTTTSVTIPSIAPTTPISSSTTSHNATNNYPEVMDLNILELNDVHGQVEQNGKGYYGISNTSHKINEIRNEDNYDNTILIANGDMFQETALSYLSYGKVVIEAMNEMEFDCMGIGNHEFDWGFDKILNYFDGNLGNGEANFPLVNSNVYYNNSLIANDNIVSSLVIDKGFAQIGVISLIGDYLSSVNQKVRTGYSFKASNNEIVQIVSEIGSGLKESGVDIIIVNIHGGSSEGIDKYKPNLLLSELKYKDKNLVDAVLNGHTHHNQSGLISRANGLPMPVIQAGSWNRTLGRIDFKYNTNKNELISVNPYIMNNDSFEYESNVEQIIDDYTLASNDKLKETYCNNLVWLDHKSDYLDMYVANLMMTGTNSSAASFNDGNFRSDVATGNLTFKRLYALSPFDHTVIICEISGENLKKYRDDMPNQIIYTNETDQTSIDTSKTYQLAILDYMFYSSYFKIYKTETYYDTNLTMRDFIAADLKLRANYGFNLERDYNNVLINCII